MNSPSTLAAILLCTASVCAQPTILSDDFNSTELEPFWTIVDPVGDVTVSLQGAGTGEAQLVFDIPGGVSHDLWRSASLAPRILQAAPNSDFSLEAGFDSLVTEEFQSQGIVVQQADDNLLRFDVLSRSTERFLFCAWIGGPDAIVYFDEQIADDARFLRVDRVGDTWSIGYSSDGENFTTPVSFDFPIAVNEVGVHATTHGISSEPPAFTCLVDYFFNRAAPIVPEDGVQDTEAPIADAGMGQSVRPGDLVALDGTNSSDNETALEDLLVQWSFVSTPAGSAAAFDDANSLTPTFVADAIGEFLIELVVTDAAGLASAPSQVLISSINQAPVADAGSDGVVGIGDLAVLDGLGSSDADLDPITYAWTLIDAPAGSTAVLADADTATPSFVADLEGTYSVQLIVDDSFEMSTADTVEITAVDTSISAEEKLCNLSNALRSEPFSKFRRWYDKFRIRLQLRIASFELQCDYDARAERRLGRLLRRVDGVALRGSVDRPRSRQRTDWIVDPDLQLQVYNEIQCALDLID